VIFAALCITQRKYDLIQLSLTDYFSPSVSGLSSLRENYLYTVEALHEYLKHLSEAMVSGKGYLFWLFLVIVGEDCDMLGKT